MKIKKIAASLGLIAIVGSSLTAAAITKQTATGYFEGWTTWFGAGTVNSEHVDYAHDWWSASVKMETVTMRLTTNMLVRMMRKLLMRKKML